MSYKTVMELWASEILKVVGYISCMKIPGIETVSSVKIQEEMRFAISFPVSSPEIISGALDFSLF